MHVAAGAERLTSDAANSCARARLTGTRSFLLQGYQTCAGRYGSSRAVGAGNQGGARRLIKRRRAGLPARHWIVRSWYAYGTGFGCCCLIFSMYFWKNHF
jgi:hypothetical protein